MTWSTPSRAIGLTHWRRVTHICVGNLTIIASDNGLSPGRRQAIIWTNAGILLIGPWGTNFSEILIGIQTFSFKKMHFKMASAKWRPFRLGLNVLIITYIYHFGGIAQNHYISITNTSEIGLFCINPKLMIHNWLIIPWNSINTNCDSSYKWHLQIWNPPFQCTMYAPRHQGAVSI